MSQEFGRHCIYWHERTLCHCNDFKNINNHWLRMIFLALKSQVGRARLFAPDNFGMMVGQR